MTYSTLVALLLFYGFFLIICGIGSVVFIGKKAKTAVMSGGISGFLTLLIAYLVSTQISGAPWAGLFLSLSLFIVFSWRSTKTLFRLIELIPTGSEELKGKGIAFLIISLMAVVSLFVFIFQWLILWNN